MYKDSLEPLIDHYPFVVDLPIIDKLAFIYLFSISLSLLGTSTKLSIQDQHVSI